MSQGRGMMTARKDRESIVPEFDIGDRFRPRERRLDNPALADKMVRRNISRREIEAVLADNEIIEACEHDDRVRYILLGNVDQRPLHVVVGQDDVIDATVVISLYEADEAHGWDPESGFRRRKEDADER